MLVQAKYPLYSRTTRFIHEPSPISCTCAAHRTERKLPHIRMNPRPLALALAICTLLQTGCEERRASATIPFLGEPRQINYTYRFHPKSAGVAGPDKPAIVVVAELPFLKGGLDDILRAEGLPSGTRTSRLSYSNFRGLDVNGGAATGSFWIRNEQFGPAFGTPLSDVTVAVSLRLIPVVDRRGELSFRVNTSHQKVSGSGLASTLDHWSGGRLISVQSEIDKAFHAAQRLMPAAISSGFSGKDVAPDRGPIRSLHLIRAKFVTTVASPVAMEFVFTPD